ncbi:MAG: pyridoxamine 5'-phosphate oxidase family protein [Acidobacteria bacterium]|nr:pyridoxamine 5'-phosphate oxidase family protein [Acidobacteriota bacterium]
MNTSQANALRQLLQTQETAALGTVHDGAPYVSMVPFAVMPDGQGIVIHVSGLAAHTKDMEHDPRVSLLVMDAPRPEVPPQALARVTVQGTARRCDAESPSYSAARAAYLGRFPHAAPMFDLGDFSLFRIEPHGLRFVGGFAQAWSASGESFARAVTGRA